MQITPRLVIGIWSGESTILGNEPFTWDLILILGR